jgi:hypothetical protein
MQPSVEDDVAVFDTAQGAVPIHHDGQPRGALEPHRAARACLARHGVLARRASPSTMTPSRMGFQLQLPSADRSSSAS